MDMALSNAEKVRSYRERLKAKKKSKLRLQEATAETKTIMRTPFWQRYQNDGNASSVEMALDIAGINAPKFVDDGDPKSASGEIERGFLNDGTPETSPYANGGGSLARAEIMVGGLIDAASELAGIINRYKRDEITARITELEQSDLSDAAVKKKAFADMAKLKKMLDQLDKQVRWSFPQWKVTGES
ncbi:hypothetical protein [Agrobacterium tumefaciens]|uniref:Uncharacterized protein n=2 Tax=Agrobacterium tumefaciens TaxID=358 RepID=A0AA44F882_AGRTU|nr:hypothetical protein [Agrobacterium tumefaciens]NSL24921.1 hypothetical protein [Agrobacterium tumefaciens]NTB86576.1 hypothetical protein [Agrobacterium tumefaciens]NTC20904.1 hypothetical protein [Agrobacterium tumefaciens]NTC30453.1 hypothetical protein [Agrobacterium tumefaciens]NTC54091.1 hypothetical protein [Agrobacterium tumefaciens]